MNSLFNNNNTPESARNARVDIELEQLKNYVFTLQDLNSQLIDLLKKIDLRLKKLERGE